MGYGMMEKAEENGSDRAKRKIRKAYQRTTE
jgi:hypothetical protein